MPNPEQLRSLWNLAVSGEMESAGPVAETRSPKAETLESILDARLPEDVFANCSPAFRPMLSQYALRQILASPVPPKEFWRHLKKYFKGLASRSGPTDAASPTAVLYYAVIAANIVHHGEKISRHSWGKLENSFRGLAGRFASDEEIARLFQKASISCRKGAQ